MTNPDVDSITEEDDGGPLVKIAKRTRAPIKHAKDQRVMRALASHITQYHPTLWIR
jgi:hypothetical protein